MPHTRVARHLAVLIAAASSTSLAGCAGGAGDVLPQLLAAKPSAKAEQGVAQAPQSELQRATEYWGKQFASNPSDLKTALNYARNLKAMGQKKQALAALQQAGVYHGQSRELAGEYGRLALELDQVQTAKTVLALADDPARPDWRVISARGAVLAKEGSYKEAIPMFERALALSNNNPSVLNNLAMAYALAGEPQRSEELLRTAVARGAPPKARQNLALVLGLQGKYSEATNVGASAMPAAVAQEDTKLVRQIVQLEPKESAPAVYRPGQVTTTAVAAAPAAAATPGPRQTAAARPALRPATSPAPATGWESHVAVADGSR